MVEILVTFTYTNEPVQLILGLLREFVRTNYRVLVTIRVNGIDVVADNDFWGILPTTLEISDATSVSAIFKLIAGDKVNVTASSSTNGVFLPGTVAVYSMRFEAARFPSPLICNDPQRSKLPLPPRENLHLV